jgi:hypothetical protein
MKPAPGHCFRVFWDHIQYQVPGLAGGKFRSVFISTYPDEAQNTFHLFEVRLQTLPIPSLISQLLPIVIIPL